MPKIATSRPARRFALGSALVGLLLFTVAAPAGAWSAGNNPPVDTREEALAAGGRRADGPRSRTVIRQGIDVSHWQGRIDWDRIARGNVDFAIIKATEGTWMVDPWYTRNRTRARRAGILFSAYHYANPSRRAGDAIREANWFVRKAKLDGTNLIPALDLEESGGLRPAQLQRWTLQWLRRVEHRLGVKPMLYTSPGFWSGQVGNTTRISRAGFDVLWLSHWGTRRPTVPGRRWAGDGWTLWQWTERGRVPGVSGWVDRNVYSGPKLRFMTIRAVRHDGRPGGETSVRDARPPRPAPF